MSEPMLVTEAASGSRKRTVRLAAAAVVVLAAAVLAPKVLFGGGGEESFEFSTPTPAPVEREAAEDTVEVVRAFSSRNPFTPLVAPASAPASPPAAEPAPVPVATVAPPAPPLPDPVWVGPDLGSFPSEPPPAVIPAPPAPAPAPVPPAPAPAPAPGEARFALAEVFQDAAGQVLARVRINDVVHEVAVGTDFAERYRLVSVDLVSRCASFLFGDKRFELCEGEETRT